MPKHLEGYLKEGRLNVLKSFVVASLEGEN